MNIYVSIEIIIIIISGISAPQVSDGRRNFNHILNEYVHAKRKGRDFDRANGV